MKCFKYLLFTTYLIFTTILTRSQVTEAYTPIEKNVIDNLKEITPAIAPNYSLINIDNRVQQNNEAVMKEVEQHQKIINSLSSENSSETNRIYYDLPSFRNYNGTDYYWNALDQLENLINSNGKSLKDAVFIVENAYLENKLNYEKYNNSIKRIADLCNIKIHEENGNINDRLTKNLSIFRFMSDTLKFNDFKNEKNVYTYPLKYDFEDYEGKNDWTKMFVIKLLYTNTGQCHSLPLFFSILAQEMGSEAFLSYSPSHSFIKIRDNIGKWYNLELTNGVIISDAAILESGYIKSEAIKNKIYLDTLGTNKIIAQCFIDLAQGYKFKYGYDEFVLACIEKSLKYFPNNIFAIQMKADYLTLQTFYIASQYGEDRIIEMRQDSTTISLFNLRNALYKKIDEMGFEQMPPEKY